MPNRRTNSRKQEPRNTMTSGNPAKSQYTKGSGNRRKSTGAKKKSSQGRSATTKGRTRGNNRATDRTKVIGLGLSATCVLFAIVFIWSLLILNMLPNKYLLVITGLLCLITGGLFANQATTKGRGLWGKFFCIIMILSLGAGTFYIAKTNNMLSSITGNNGLKINHMVVAVRVDDTAEDIHDARNYEFGIDEGLQKEDIATTITEIETEVGQTISVVDCEDVAGQAEALLDGRVDAVIYNEAYVGILEELNPDYASQVRVIYTFDIEIIMDDAIVEVDVTKDPFYIYISGIDVYGSISKNSRSDVNILAHVNPSTNQILLVNTPRDYYVEIPGVSQGQKDKLTHAGIYGVDASMSTLEELYDIDIHYYARANFTSLITMVDALGGIEVYAEQSFTTHHDPFKVYQGMNTFTGRQALAFCRERYSLDGGDNQRGRNQQAVITAMIQKVVSPAIITGATGLISSVSGNVDTNMPQSDMQSLIKYQLSEGASWNIKSMAATGNGTNESCYSYPSVKTYVMYPDWDAISKIKEAMKALENGEVLTDAMIAQ